MHKIDLSQTTESHSPQSTQADGTVDPIVDESKAANDNQAPLHSLDKSQMKQPTSKIILIAILLAVTGGVATGFGTYRLSGGKVGGTSNSSEQIQHAVEGQVSAGDVFGSQDTAAYKDTAQGYLEIGGIDGEGSHKLLRPGGVSQTVYLTSSITNLSDFEGMEVKIWGETFKGQQAGWLMDVGRVEVLTTEAQPPAE